MCSCVDLIALIFISKTSDMVVGLKAVNGYQKRPNETMQLIMWIEICPARDVWSYNGTFRRPEDNVRDSGTECPKPGRLVSLGMSLAHTYTH